MAHFQHACVRCRCVIFIICDWLKSVIYGISASDVHACMHGCIDAFMIWWVSTSIYLSIRKHVCTRESEFQMKLSKPWHKQYKHLKSSGSDATSTAIESIVYLRIWSLAVLAAVFFDQFSHFPNITNATLATPSSSCLLPPGFREQIEKCVQIPIVILYEISNCHCFDIYVISNERLFRHWWKKCGREMCQRKKKNEEKERSFYLAIFNFREVFWEEEKTANQPTHTYTQNVLK